MNEYLVRFADGTMKHIKADKCIFVNAIGIGGTPMANFYKNGQLYYAITLDSISAIRFPEVENHDESDSGDGDT